MAIIAYRQAVADALTAQATKVLTKTKLDVGTHAGRYTVEDLGRFPVGALAVRVAFLGVTGMSEKGRGYATCDFAVFVIASGKPGLLPDAQGVAVLEWVLATLDLDRVPLPEGLKTSRAEKLRADVLFNGIATERAVWLGATRWQLGIRADALDGATAAGLGEFLRLNTTTAAAIPLPADLDPIREP